MLASMSRGNVKDVELSFRDGRYRWPKLLTALLPLSPLCYAHLMLAIHESSRSFMLNLGLFLRLR